MPPKTFGAGGILFSGVSVGETVRPENFVNIISQKPLKGILPNLVTYVYGFIDVLIRFWDQKVKGQGHSR